MDENFLSACGEPAGPSVTDHAVPTGEYSNLLRNPAKLRFVWPQDILSQVMTNRYALID